MFWFYNCNQGTLATETGYLFLMYRLPNPITILNILHTECFKVLYGSNHTDGVCPLHCLVIITLMPSVCYTVFY